MSDTPQSTNKMHLNGHAHLLRGATPNKPGPAYQVINLDAGQRIEGLICSPSVWGVETHWNPARGKIGRSQRCTMDKTKSCVGCDKNLPKRWKGYLHFWDLHTQKEAFLEITPANFEAITKQVDEDRNLRGLKLKARRTDGGKQGRLIIDVMMSALSIEGLAAPRDPEPYLELLWEWGD